MPPDATRTPARRRAPTRRKGPPSPLLLFLPPLLITTGTVAVAAVHASLGSPLGPAFAAEVWALAKTFVAASLALGGFGGFVVANNRRAWEALDEGDDGRGPASLDGHDAPAPQSPRPITSRSIPPRPATGRQNVLVTDTMRRRRTGRLTPVEPPPALPAAEPAAPDSRKARQAGGGGSP